MNEPEHLEAPEGRWKRIGPVEAAFHVTLERIRDLSQAGLLDEETLTACLLGGVAVTAPMLAELLGSGEGQPRTCSWGGYNKAGRASDARSEAASGADFCLVIWESPELARVVVIQAKKAEEYKRRRPVTVDIHRGPKKDSGRPPQLVMLAVTGLRITRLLEGKIAPRSDVALLELKGIASADRKAKLGEFGWIHYLVYRNGSPVCLPLSAVPAHAIDKEFMDKPPNSNLVELDGTDRLFFDLIRDGLAEDLGPGWLQLDKSIVDLVLPDLLELMPVYVADEKGGGFELISDDVVYAGREIAARQSTLEQVASLSAIANGDANAPEPGGTVPSP